MKEQLNNGTMTTYKAVITEETSGKKGEIVGNTKSPGKYKGMTLDQFAEAVEYVTPYTIEIVNI